MYETIFVVDSLLKSDEIDNIINKYERFISANGGQIEATERWGKKRLAYEIKKRQYGYFVMIRFDGPPTMIKPLEREYRLNESLLRFKTLIMPQAALKHMAAIKKAEAVQIAEKEALKAKEAAEAAAQEEAAPEVEAVTETETAPAPEAEATATEAEPPVANVEPETEPEEEKLKETPQEPEAAEEEKKED
jgi:small subunit ribosomal protein S6